jgi:uncharacterized membrane protein
MGVLKKIFLDRKEWWQIVPDQTLFASGGNTNGQVLNLAARHKSDQWIMAYLAGKSTVSIHMDRITAAAKVKAFWIDPRTGTVEQAGEFPNTGVQAFTTPADWEDALLVLEPAGG